MRASVDPHYLHISAGRFHFVSIVRTCQEEFCEPIKPSVHFTAIACPASQPVVHAA
jgi:hypothetical protein